MPEVQMPRLDHFQIFEKGGAGEWKGHRPLHWCKSIGHTFQPRNSFELSDSAHTRADLLAIAQNSQISALDLCMLTFAWGKMRADNGRRLLGCMDWLVVAEAVRGGLSHIEAYEKFFELSSKGKMPGCGPAYYTKLLFALPLEKERGVIMDQWTARSINLLYPNDSKIMLIRTAAGFRVSPKNDRNVYSQFVGRVKKLSQRIGSGTEETEQRLFCQGGRSKGTWRQHVIRHG